MKKFYQSGFILIFFLTLTGSALAQEAFVVTQEQDTLSVEKFIRERDMLQGRLLVIKQQIPISYEARLDINQGFEEISVAAFHSGAAADAQPLQEGTLKFEENRILAVTKQGGAVKKDTFQTDRKALTYHPNIPIISLLEQIVLRGKAVGEDKVTVPVFFMSSGGKTAGVEINFTEKDSARVSMGNMQVHLKLNERGEIISGSTSNGMHITRTTSLPDSALATTPPDYSAPPGASYTAEDVTINTAAGHTLAGTLTVPKNSSGPVPVVVTITGSSPQDRDHNTPFGGNYKIYRHLADTLAKEGIAVLRMDDRGIGQSTGDFATATTADRADDIREGIKYARQRKELDSEKIFLTGLSEGALIATMIAAQDDDLAGIVLMAGPASTGREIMNYQIEQSLSTVDSLQQTQKTKLMQDKISELEDLAEEDPWLNYFLNEDPASIAKKVEEVPVLILHGSTDKNVPPQDAKELEEIFTTAGNEDVTLIMFEDLNHIFIKDPNGHPQHYSKLESFEIAPEVFAEIRSWINERR